MSRTAVLEGICLAEANADCRGLRDLGVVAARMSNGRATWAHAGILYRWKKSVRLFELRTHRKLSDEPIKDESPRLGKIALIEPRIQPERALLLKAKCQLISQRQQEEGLPYGFVYDRTAFDEQGTLRLGSGEVGVTCATIVDAVFKSEGMPLLDPNKWPSPDDDDKKSRRMVIDDIRKRDPEHADVLEAEIDAPRIRPEEVVAAAAIHPTIGTFDSLIDGAAVVSQRLGL